MMKKSVMLDNFRTSSTRMFSAFLLSASSLQSWANCFESIEASLGE
jgi:hypothetical protein